MLLKTDIKISNLWNKIRKSNLSHNLTLFILLPAASLILFLIVVSSIYQKQYTDNIKEKHILQMEYSCLEMENSVEIISYFVNTIVNGVKSPKASFPLLQALADIDSLPIDYVYIYDRKNGLVYHQNTDENATAFFVNERKYTSYSTSFLYEYPYNQHSFKMLEPTFSVQSSSKKVVMPLVFSNIGILKGTDYHVFVDIDISGIINLNQHFSNENDSISLVVNNSNRFMFDDSIAFTKKPGTNFYSIIYSNDYATFDSTFDDTKYLVMSHRSNSELDFPYTSVFAIPYSEINKATSDFTVKILMVLVLALGTTYCLVSFSSKKVYSPIKALTRLFNESSSSSGDPITTLQVLIQKTLASNQALSNKITSLLPLAIERQLVRYLNGYEEALADEGIVSTSDFKYRYFCAVIIKIIPREKFYLEQGNIKLTALKYELQQLAFTVFSELFTTYTIPSEQNTIYFIFNLPEATDTTPILDAVQAFQNTLVSESNYYTVNYAVGNVYENVAGLKLSHDEAIDNIASNLGVNSTSIIVRKKKNNFYQYGVKEENSLYNLLVLGKITETRLLINSLIEKNVDAGISSSNLLQLYIQLISSVLKVLRQHDVDYDPNNIGDLSLISDITNRPIPKVHETLMGFLDLYESVISMKYSKSKVEIQDFINYIEDNFAKDLSLEIVATHFSTTPKYLSKLIKDKLNITFTDYLATIRVNHAKTLLLTTKKGITEIYESAGFTSKTTFLRTFKAHTNLTPTEFRKSKQMI